MKNILIGTGLASSILFSSQLDSQESKVSEKYFLDYFASHLRMTQQLLNGQDNHATVVAFEGELDKKCLIESLKHLFHVHPSLRAKNIKYDDLEERFYIDGDLIFSDISCEFAEIEEENDWRQVVTKELSRPFPSDGPYWKVCCLTVKNSQPARHYLIQFFDHSLSDGISTAKLNDACFAYYDALRHQSLKQ